MNSAFVRGQQLWGETEHGILRALRRYTIMDHLAGNTFAMALRQSREEKRLSQSRLAAAAGFDHSYVSRLESGTRTPTRDAVSKLGEALALDDIQVDALLAAAGFMPARIENLLAAEPVVGEVLGLLQNGGVPEEVREDLRAAISLLIRQAQRASAPAWSDSGSSDESIVAAD
jgi:transcriptional regulator with XRE-family HTH domain